MNNEELKGGISQQQAAPQPQATARVATAIKVAAQDSIDRDFDPDAFIDEMRAEYSHRIKNGQQMCDYLVKAGCVSEMGKKTGVCSFRDYLGCCKATLQWRKKEVAENQKNIGTMVTDEELQATQYVLDKCISTIDKFLLTSGIK